MNTKVIGRNKNKFIAFVESYNNKFIGMKVKDENNFDFWFIPDANRYKEEDLNKIIENVKNGYDLSYSSSVRKASVELNSPKVYTDVVYNYPNHLGTKGMEDMAKDFDKFLSTIDLAYKSELVTKLLNDFDKRMGDAPEM